MGSPLSLYLFVMVLALMSLFSIELATLECQIYCKNAMRSLWAVTNLEKYINIYMMKQLRNAALYHQA